MAQLWSTGPAHVYVAVAKTMPGSLASAIPNYSSPSSLPAPYYLGTAEGAPVINVEPVFTPVMNDIGGSIPTDYMFHGEEGLIQVDLTRWNELVYTACAQRPAASVNTAGAFGATDIGTLMATEGMTYDVWVQFPYATKSAYTGLMPAGYHFWSCFMIGPDGILPGTRANKRTCIFKAIRALNTTTNTWTTYDKTLVGIPAIPPVGATGNTSSSGS